DEAWIEQIRAQMPELPAARRARFVNDYSLPLSTATSLTALPALADVFEATARAGVHAILDANWVLGEFSAAVNKAEVDPAHAPVSGAQLGALLKRIEDGTISGKIAKEVFDAMWAGEAIGPDAADAIIEKRGLKQISDADALEKIVDEVLAASSATV